MSLFFTCWYKSRKVKCYFNDYWVGMLKNEQDLLDPGTVKSGVSHKWFGELTRLTEWFLHAGSGWIIVGLTINLFCIFDICWVSTAVEIVKNDVLLLVATEKALEFGLPKCF